MEKFSNFNEGTFGSIEDVKDFNILEFIDSLIEQGYTDEEASRCADYAFSDDWQHDDD